jgi:hypothetical protein
MGRRRDDTAAAHHGFSRQTRCRPDGRCRTLACVFRFAVLAFRAFSRAAMTAAPAPLSSAPLSLALLSPAALTAVGGARG